MITDDDDIRGILIIIETTIIIKTRDDPLSYEHKTIPDTRNASKTNTDGRQRHQTTYLSEMMYLQHDISRTSEREFYFLTISPCVRVGSFYG